MYPALQTPLKYGWSQYVGDLSFGIYALHPPIVITVFRQWYEPMRIETFGDGLLSHVPGLVLIHLLVFSAGDYFSMLDKRVVRMGRWMQEQFFERW
jgi:peptidoglycan/LPS O-acetylase OafA/YrhL